MIEMKYLLGEGQEAAEGTVTVECEKCKRKFAIPAGANLMAGAVCEECATADAANELKEEKSDDLKAAQGE